MGEPLREMQSSVDESEINVLLDDAGINIWIDKYTDVFSDFDTRPLLKRKLSNDFISEITKMVRDNPTSNVELNFNILCDTKDPKVEAIINSHLFTHFTNNKRAEEAIVKRTFRKGYLLTSLGFTLILVLAYVASIAKGIFFINSLPVLIEPLAWFVTWTGLDHIFRNYGNETGLDINSRMLKSRISFMCMGQADQTETETIAAPKQRKVIPAGNNLRIA
jgi:hypothetical protein